MSKCIACLEERQLDIEGLCDNCDPSSPEVRTALLNLLKTPTQKETI